MFFHRRPLLISKTWEVITVYRAHRQKKRVSTPKRQTEHEGPTIQMSAVYASHRLALMLSQYPILTEIIRHSHRPDLKNLTLVSKGVRNAIFTSPHRRGDPFKNCLCASSPSGARCIACGTRTCKVRQQPLYLHTGLIFTVENAHSRPPRPAQPQP